MNDLFDIMNIRFLKDAIKNDVAEWARRRKVLDTFLCILENTERMFVVLETKRKEKEKQERQEERRMEREKANQKKNKNNQKNNQRKRINISFSEDEETDSGEEDDLFKDPEDQKKKAQEQKKAARKKRQSNKTFLFASQTTMEGWRLTIKSMIDLIEELFDCGYKFVMTAMFNQDIIEVRVVFSLLLRFVVSNSLIGFIYTL
jgi:isochorismate synthase EntC